MKTLNHVFTDAQVEWLKKQPNQSKAVRDALDAYIRTAAATEHSEANAETPETRRAKLLVTLNNRLQTKRNERAELFRVNQRLFKGCDRKNEGEPEFWAPHYVVEGDGDDPATLTPLGTEGEIVKAQLEALDSEIAQLTKQIESILAHRTNDADLPTEYTTDPDVMSEATNTFKLQTLSKR